MIESPFEQRSVVWDAPRLKAEIAELELELELMEQRQSAEPEQGWRRRLYQRMIANRRSMLRPLEACLASMASVTRPEAVAAPAFKPT